MIRSLKKKLYKKNYMNSSLMIFSDEGKFTVFCAIIKNNATFWRGKMLQLHWSSDAHTFFLAEKRFLVFILFNK